MAWRVGRSLPAGKAGSLDRASSVDDLEAAIYDYPLQHNTRPKPYVWTKTADDILTRERRALDALDKIRGNR